MALISVIIPVYGTEQYIARCLDSVLAQSFKDFEIIVVNDCTKDKSMEIVGKYVQIHNNIKVVEHSTNQGLMIARKSGYKIASGKYIVFLDSDDTLPETALGKLYSEISDADVKIVSGGYRFIFDNGNSEERHPQYPGIYKTKEAIELCLQGKMNHNLAFAIFEKKLFDKDYITIPHQTNGEDLILFYQLVKEAGTIKIIPEIAYDYYQNFASSSNSAPNLSKLRQLAKAQNFKYEFCTNLNINKHILLRNILSIVASWPMVKNGKQAYNDLHKDIKKEINLISYFRYFPVIKALYLTVLAFLPSLVVNFFVIKRLNGR